MAGFDLLFAALPLKFEVVLERLLAKSSVHMGNGWFVLFAVMPLMCFLSGCLQNRASAWGMAGFDLVFAAMPLMCFLSGCLQNRASAWGMAGFDLVFAAMPLTCFLSRMGSTEIQSQIGLENCSGSRKLARPSRRPTIYTTNF